MNRKYKVYIRINLVSLFFIAVSFISVTLAWFAYSGLSSVATEVDVKAWYIELEQDGVAVSNNIVISLSEIYPGMDIVNETVDIKNFGDSDAQVKYSVVSARILDKPEDNYLVDDVATTSDYVEDILSHDYPFHINMNLTKGYVLSNGESSAFEVSISWPLDSDNDAEDSLWGTSAYQFQNSEMDKKNLDPNYQIKPAIQVVISVTAEQYLEDDTTSDPRYDLGDTVLFDVINNSTCETVSSTCLKTYVLDVNNLLGDDTVTLLPDPTVTYSNAVYDNYNNVLTSVTTGWTVNTRALMAEDILGVIATDIMSSVLVRDSLSDLIIGDISYGTRSDQVVSTAVSYGGYFKFINNNFTFLDTSNCYWTNSEYDVDKGFAIVNNSITDSKIYGELKTTSCNVIPVIIASKSNL